MLRTCARAVAFNSGLNQNDDVLTSGLNAMLSRGTDSVVGESSSRNWVSLPDQVDNVVGTSLIFGEPSY